MKNQRGESSIESIIGGLGLIFFIVVILIKAFGGISSEYSRGERTGIPFKMSYKGIFCKSYEGQLDTGAILTRGENISSVWDFTVEDSALVKQIDAAAEKGQRVQLSYWEPLLNSSCRSSSGYFVTAVKVLQ